MKDIFEFDLSNPIKVQGQVKGKNEFIEIDKLYLSAPTYKHRDHTIRLKKDFIVALFAMTQSMSSDQAQRQIDSNSDAEENTLDAKAIKATLYAADGFDIVKYFNNFTKFLSSNVCFKDEDLKDCIKTLELEKLDENDLENLIAKYIEVFFIVSWMKTLN